MSTLESWSIGRPWGTGSACAVPPLDEQVWFPAVSAVQVLDPDVEETANCVESGHSFTRNQLDGLVTVKASTVAVRSKTS
jgi:hypothetical protein